METINLRLDAVEELSNNGELFYNSQEVISRFIDIEHMLGLCVQVPKQETVKTAEAKIANVIYLKHTLELVTPLRNIMKKFLNPLFRAYYVLLEDPRFEKLLAKIRTVIHDDTRYHRGTLNMRTQKCFAIKPNINGLLDVARRTYTELIDDITELTDQLSNEFNLPLRAGYNSTRGFHLQMTAGGKAALSRHSLPACFIKVSQYKGTLFFTTADFIRLNDRSREALNEIYMMSNVVVTGLLNSLMEDIGCLYKLTECVATVDMMLSFAHLVTVSDCVRPEFTDTLAVKDGRHPILDAAAADRLVSNDIYASADSNFVIVTGANMSGKSTYLRQVALLQIVAQIGSFVPAKYASFRLCDQIFSRIGSDDDIETNSSTFMLEMKEANYIVQNATGSSLIIMDELGRGTSSDEGVALCFAICEYLLHLKAFTFFATHFYDVTKLSQLYPNVENYHLQCEKRLDARLNKERLSFSHILRRGVFAGKHYGLELAELTTLPQAVITDAWRISDQLQTDLESNDVVVKVSPSERAVFKLAYRLIQLARNGRLGTDQLRLMMKSLKEQFSRDAGPGTSHSEE